MLNKKLLAVSIAALFTASANAAVSLDADPVVPVSYGQKAIKDSVRDNMAIITSAGNELGVTVNAGFAIPVNTTRFVRFSLTNARFVTASNLALVNAVTTGVTITRLSGGADKSDFVVFQVQTTSDPITDTSLFTLTVEGLEISQSANANVAYGIYENATSAITAGGALFTKTGALATVKAESTGNISASANLKAAVAKDFKELVTTFGGAKTAVLGTLGGATAGGYLVAAPVPLDNDSSTVVLADVLDASQTVVFTGDFSFGKWITTTAADCTTGAVDLPLNDAKTIGTTAALNITTTDAHLCLDNSVAKEVIKRGSYSVSLTDDELSGSLGTISYDTTSVSIPYLTTFANYNQRVYIINKGSKDADYSISFRTETDAVATPGDAATGTVAANSVLAIKASDIVTLVGKTRTSATIEIEAVQADILATTQTVNLSDGSTDTVDLAVSQ